MEGRLGGAGFRPELRVPELNFRPVELRPGGVVEKPEELMTNSQRAARDKLQGLFRGIDAQFSQRGELEESGPALVLRSLPKGVEVARDKVTGDPLTDSKGNLIVKVGNQHFAVTNKNLQAKPDGSIHYTPSNFAADPKGTQAAAEASTSPTHGNSDPNAPHPVATVFQPKPTPQTAAQKLAEEQAQIQQQARASAAAAAAAKKAEQANATRSEQQDSTSNNKGKEPNRAQFPQTSAQTVEETVIDSYSHTATVINQFRQTARTEDAEKETEKQIGLSNTINTSAALAVAATGGTSSDSKKDQQKQEDRERGSDVQSKQYRENLTKKAAGSEIVSGGTPGKSR
jgi:hypothetical protein